jgi:hypothetical protein
MADGPTTGSWKGVAGMLEGFGHWLSAWEDLRFYADGYRELDDERVFVLAHISGRGATSGLDVGKIRAEGAALFPISNGKVTRLVQYNDREHAREDLGLTPEAGAP